ncbi:MAG: radical SAM protein [Candidatus Eremiobacterota bacterium]
MKDLRLAGLDQGRVLVGPESVHLDVTNSCNTNCVTCWDHSPWLREARAPAWKRRRVECQDIEGLLDDILGLGGLRAVVLSGMGEPFTHPEIYPMIEAVKRRGLHLTVITNLIAADADRILDLGVDQLLIGVQGASPESYRAFHPSFQGDEWERLLAMLDRFAKAGRRYKHVQVICRENAHELVEMVGLAHRFSASQLNFKLASLKDGTEAVRVTEEQRSLLLERLVPEARQEAQRLGVPSNLDVFQAQLAAGGARTAPIESIGCFMGHYYSRVLVDGTVLYCCNVEVVVGRLSPTVRFSDLWNGPEWNALRQRLRRGEYFPGCSQCGKLNQNVKLAERFGRAFGEARLRAVTGRG